MFLLSAVHLIRVKEDSTTRRNFLACHKGSQPGRQIDPNAKELIAIGGTRTPRRTGRVCWGYALHHA
ncbi:hypothetical protein TNCV_2550981 [Trichonephila clavipes]|nr:hypothetical protein TNCV_2550981 [Trichonephila clavipes]